MIKDKVRQHQLVTGTPPDRVVITTEALEARVSPFKYPIDILLADTSRCYRPRIMRFMMLRPSINPNCSRQTGTRSTPREISKRCLDLMEGSDRHSHAVYMYRAYVSEPRPCQPANVRYVSYSLFLAIFFCDRRLPSTSVQALHARIAINSLPL